MSKSDDKIKDIFDNQKAELPDGFWETIEPNIPVYKSEKKRYWGLPLFGCLTMSFAIILALAGIVYYSLDNPQSIGSAIDDHNVENTIMITDGEQDNIEEPMDLQPKEELVLQNSGSLFDGLERDLPNHRNSNVHQIDGDLDEPKAKVKEVTSLITDGMERTELFANNSSNLTKSNEGVRFEIDMLKSSVDDDTPSIKSRNLEPEMEGEKTMTQTITLLEPLDPEFKIQENVIDIKMNIIEPLKPIVSDNGKYYVEVGYNALSLSRELTLRRRNLSKLNREANEKPFISHEIEISSGLYFSDHFYVFGGARYTQIQELFDYRMDMVSTENFKLAQGYRRIEHTNTVSMLDALLGIGITKSWNKLGLGAELKGGYNISFNQSGKLIDEFNQLRTIESFNQNQDSSMFKDRTGFNIGLNVNGSYSLRPNMNISVSVGARNYLRSFTSDSWSYAMNYQGLTTGLSLRYKF